MLVLTRKRDEVIKIGANIVIRVIKTSKGTVKLGIEAPDSVRIKRGEIATLEEPDLNESNDQEFEELMNDSMYAALLVQS